MRTRPVAITDLPPSPEDEQRSRIRKYAFTMGIRMVCIVACLFTPGWWLLIPALGAVFLPYVAVVVANATSRRTRGAALRPDGRPLDVEQLRLESPIADARRTDPRPSDTPRDPE